MISTQTFQLSGKALLYDVNNNMISIENMLYIIENLDQFGYNDLKHLGFDDIQIDKLSDIFEKINDKNNNNNDYSIRWGTIKGTLI